MNHLLCVLSLSLATCSIGAAAQGALAPTKPRCEYRANPLGIDVAAPRLTWQLESSAQGQRQTAYQILVADSEEALNKDTGTLWDSGRVESEETALVPYGGAALASRTPCYWKVRVWDKDGQPSDWSETARWSMGLLEKGDWQAKWIGYDAPAEPQQYVQPQTHLTQSKWIWGEAEKPAETAAAGPMHFRTSFELPADDPVISAHLYIAADDRGEAYLNGVHANAGQSSIGKTAQVYDFDVHNYLTSGRNVVGVRAENGGDTEGPAGIIAALVVHFASGATKTIATDESWKVSKRGRPHWEAQDFDDSKWEQATVAAAYGKGPWGELQAAQALELPPPPYLRKEFEAKSEITRATIYASALGIYELHLNGERVGDYYFTPGWTDYAKRVYYNTYDVTGQVKAGAANALGAILADGWYSSYLGFRLLNNMDRPRGFYGDEPRFCAQLEIVYADGSKDVITTDDSWKAAYGPIREADLLMGETHDLRLAMEGWAASGFDDSQWAPVAVQDSVEPVVEAYPGVPVVQTEEFPAQSVTELRPGVFIYDLGQNMVGWVRIKANGQAGQKVQVRHAEMLEGDGALYTVALRKARAMDTYYLQGEGPEVLEPGFTFHGFRYVEITGLEEPPAKEDVVGMVVHSDIHQTGEFECSEPLLNQLFHNIVWGQKGNYLEVPTDCPQRDERLGWTGDAQFFMPTAAYTSDVGAFFTKWLVDLVQDSQLADGSWADVAPNVELGGGAVAWGDAAIVCTYQMYRYYGDTRVIAEHYDYLVKGMDFLEGTSENFIRTKLGYGDWVNLGGGAKDEVICTAYYYYLSTLMQEMSAVIGKDDMAEKYGALAENIRKAFIDNFVKEDGSIVDSSQTGYALAFTMGLIPEDRFQAASDQFAKTIHDFDGHLATGFIGTPRLLPGLSVAGRRDLAYHLLMNKDFPSWLYQVTLGATTMWERWDGWNPAKGFQTPGMNSFNHYAFGSVGEFLYKEVGGIQSTSPSFKEIRIAPKPGGGLTWANVSYDSIRGEIRSNWKVAGQQMTLEVTVPPNVTAKVYVPAGSQEDVQAPESDLVSFEKMEEGCAVYSVQPGTHTFTTKLPVEKGKLAMAAE
ncbi:MAG: family 78 glycoside hydrolase catalytic domain [Candidatus Hydrogenedentes bacterium]|nr:family 78 glycoside hydrolase catalytic domain [Candidatus Hydrogenedentota bacterium]